MPEPAILHRCPHCGRVFDSPSFCAEGQVETKPEPMVVPSQTFERLRGDVPPSSEGLGSA